MQCANLNQRTVEKAETSRGWFLESLQQTQRF